MDEASARAAYAADSVRALFGRRLLGLPGTYLPHVVHPGPRRWAGPWHYWWLAHVIDGLVDEAQREQRWGRSDRAATATTLADRLLRSIRLRNLGRFTNHYYDDMGWLLLAAQRLNALLAEAGPHAGTRTRRLSLQAGRVLRPAVLRGHTAELGGGVFWNDHHDFKNAPATGPAAIFLARIGETTQARALLDWMDDHLRDPDTGLVIDGIRVAPDGTQTLVRDIYTYNQGTVLGGLVELAERGDHECAARAETLVAAVAAHCAAPAATGHADTGPRLLRTHGDGDGGLFTGILVRYLARAARSEALRGPARATAACLVSDTADAWWAGRRAAPVTTPRGMPPARVAIFSPDPAVPASDSQPDGIPVELSTQVQAWLALEAAATLT